MRLRTIAAAGFLLFAIATIADEPKKEAPEVTQMLKEIAGKENKPAGEVFQNVQLMKDVPAARFLRIMDQGYARALGVDCEHCHSPEMWEADDKRPKRAAREMQLMHRMVNQELQKMQHIQTPPTANRAISCIACHRGAAIPAP